MHVSKCVIIQPLLCYIFSVLFKRIKLNRRADQGVGSKVNSLSWEDIREAYEIVIAVHNNETQFAKWVEK